MKERDLDRIAASLERIAYLLEQMVYPADLRIYPKDPKDFTAWPTSIPITTNGGGQAGPSHDEYNGG